MSETDPAPGRREANKERTRCAIVSSAYTVLAREGFDGLTADRLAEEAGVSRRTFFNYFPSVDAVLAERAGDVADALNRAIAGRPSTEPLIDSAVAVVDETMTTELLREVVPVWQALESAPASARYAMQQHDTKVLELADLVVRTRLADSGGSEGDIVLRAAVTTSALLAAFEAARRFWLAALDRPVDDAARDDLVATVTRAFLLLREGLSHEPRTD